MSEEQLSPVLSSAPNYKIIAIIGIIIVSLVFGFGFMYHLYDNKSKELDSVKKQQDISKSIADTNAKLDDMIKRENTLYPQLLATKNELAINNSKLTDIQNTLKLTGKDTIDAEVSKMDLNSISNYLNSRGYPNTIISR